MVPTMFFGLLFGVCWVYWRNGSLEGQIVSGSIFVTSIASQLLPSLQPRAQIQLVIALLALAPVMAIALRSTRFWPMWVTGLQVCIVGWRCFNVFAVTSIPVAFDHIEWIWNYSLLLILAGAAYKHNNVLEELRRSTPLNDVTRMVRNEPTLSPAALVNEATTLAAEEIQGPRVGTTAHGPLRSTERLAIYRVNEL